MTKHALFHASLVIGDCVIGHFCMWSQNYTPLGSLAPSALIAAIPIVVLLALLGVWRVRAHIAALAGLASAALLALFVYKMPATLVLGAAGYGAAFGLFPIGWIVLNAIFIYELSVVTGQFEVLKQHIAGLAGDRRIQTLLVAFCFGAFIEGCAGFGAPVAITGAMLIGLGFKPLEAAKLALIGNTAPVAFGSLGIPITTLSSVTGLDLMRSARWSDGNFLCFRSSFRSGSWPRRPAGAECGKSGPRASSADSVSARRNLP